MHTTPPSLLERVRLAEDHHAWQEFIDLYSPLIYTWAIRMGLQASDAADLMQDVFVTLLRKMPEFRYQPGGSFRGWLRTVVVNHWRDARRRRLVDLPEGEEPLPDELTIPDTAARVWEEEYHQHLVGRALELMKGHFQPSTWQACWQVVVEGRPPADVAAELGLSVPAIYTAKSRVLHRLRQELEGMLD
jgi:RNA polymerase sigma-70 factor (ECF subfamily)